MVDSARNVSRTARVSLGSAVSSDSMLRSCTKPAQRSTCSRTRGLRPRFAAGAERAPSKRSVSATPRTARIFAAAEIVKC